ncbi:hypothetical protein Ddc_08666 [Ditylenchus destructor]|nr:hypothetical protein Ddc_08666 [Ditylenchus destructor]
MRAPQQLPADNSQPFRWDLFVWEISLSRFTQPKPLCKPGDDLIIGPRTCRRIIELSGTSALRALARGGPRSVPTRGLRPLEHWLCQCQLAAFGRSKGVFLLFSGFVSANSRPSAARKEFSCFSVALSVPTRGLRPLER